MPSILSRFKRSPSTSSTTSETDLLADPHEGRPGSSSKNRRISSVSASSYNLSEGEEGDTLGANSDSPRPGKGGSLFVENFDNTNNNKTSTGGSPIKRQITPSPRNKPSPLSLPIPPASNSKSPQPLGTPKLVLTEEGSNSPRSFSSSPVVTSPTSYNKANRPNLGLGLTDTSRGISEDELETPTAYDNSFQSSISKMSLPVAADSPNRNRSGSVISSNGGGRSRRGSILSKHTNKDLISPPLSPNALQPIDSRQTSGSKKSSRKKKRTKSINSTSGQSGIAAALAKGGLHLPGTSNGQVTPEDILNSLKTKKRSLQKRSPFLTTSKDNHDAHYLDGQEYEGEDGAGFDDDFDEDDDSDSDLDDDLPVTGFAVASNRRNADFHALFPSIDEGDYLIEDYGCALSKDILLQGRLYVSENHLCFHANILGWVTDVVVAFADIRTIEKKMTALVIPNAIQVSTGNAKYTFASLIARDSTYDVMMNIWRLCNPNAVMSSVSLGGTNMLGSRPGSVVGDEAEGPATAGTGGAGGSKGHAPTQCACGKDGKHYNEIALDTTFHSTPEKIYELMFNSGWFKNFLSESQKLRDIECSEWRPISPDNPLLTRSTSYIKPLNGSIGPKQTKCHITDDHDHLNFDDYISLITTTRTPDVPSGGVFSVKTRTCLMWAGKNSTNVVVTTTVEWTGKSWVKGIIEKSAIEGQKQYHDDLESGMRQYIKDHPGEFAGAGGADEDEEDEAGLAEGEKAQLEDKSEAQAYADQTRKQRKEEDMGLLQYSFDTLISGLKSIASGIKGIAEGLNDLLMDTPFKIQNLMGVIIVLLVISNIYTYLSIDKSASKERRYKKLGTGAMNAGRAGGGGGIGKEDMRRIEEVDDVFERAIKRIILDRQEIGPAGTEKLSPKEEIKELMRSLDRIESRVSRLRDSIAKIEVDGTQQGKLNGLD
ncbi:uncharacterized protein I303_100739 [Kwoniella dejecticola CBS 10117]|uniref:VASt domain-containing protein n=1 Tax=Kwoniella dejecticola CBS 10117 TaxID=1296121 RepID=A0A1A6AFU7_9TREE|nr:uncharacterized protein I303_00742 [Kwoniella dejecticola CBS 10117]OBR88924.1 hypothetical protein I303_00742 [Kwoniella dejecticola CBS 10117]